MKIIVNFLRARLRKFINEETWLQDFVREGMKVGADCDINPGVVFDASHCWLIEIGNRVTIAPQAYLLAHDASTFRTLGYTKIGKVKICDGAFIGARALIMPGVTVGENAVVAAGSVVTRAVAANAVVAGNPAKEITTTPALMEKHRLAMLDAVLYDESYRKQQITTEKKAEMSQTMEMKAAYVR